MARKKQKTERLPRNFHKTFIPERQYINAMLRFAASGKSGDYQQICAETGIPTGTSSGKVPAILDYCRGMGFIVLGGETRSAVKEPQLTPFGRVVLLEDPHLKEEVTQWIAHLNLCSPLTGADVWYQTFFAGMQTLGMRFQRSKLEQHLALVYKTQKSGIVGPLIRMYEDDASFRVCGALAEANGAVTRRPAPLSDEFGFGYGAWILQMMSRHFSGAGQVTVTELDSEAGWRTIPGWNIAELQRALQLIERKGLISVDRHMDPWIVHPCAGETESWSRIYDDLI